LPLKSIIYIEGKCILILRAGQIKLIYKIINDVRDGNISIQESIEDILATLPEEEVGGVFALDTKSSMGMAYDKVMQVMGVQGLFEYYEGYEFLEDRIKVYFSVNTPLDMLATLEKDLEAYNMFCKLFKANSEGEDFLGVLISLDEIFDTPDFGGDMDIEVDFSGEVQVV